MNWPALMSFGLGTLRLSPQAFWSLTPREIAAAARAFGPATAPPMTPEDLTALRTQHPDSSDGSKGCKNRVFESKRRDES